MKTRMFGIAAVLAVGAGFCCLGPVILAFWGVSAVASLATLRYVVPYRNAFLGLAVITLAAPGFGGLVARRGHASRVEWAILGGSTLAVFAVIVSTISVKGVPPLW